MKNKNNKLYPKNQILKLELGNELTTFSNNQTNNKKKINVYRMQFFISFFIAFIFLCVLLWNFHERSVKEKRSEELLKNYNLTTLYQTSNVSEKLEKVSYENPFVIGMIRINKISLNYPILSQSNKELLKISLCRFAGPMPNEVGNLCIAGHNYVDYKLFSRLNELKKGDEIEIYDLNGRKLIYEVFKTYEIKPDDLSCTSQDVDGKKIITLLTCNNVNGKRTVVKAKEKQ